MDAYTTPDGRRWHLLAAVPYVRRDGTETMLDTWHTGCAVCGAAVFASTPAGSDPAMSKALQAKHCGAHKLSRAEVSRRWVDAIAQKKANLQK